MLYLRSTIVAVISLLFTTLSISQTSSYYPQPDHPEWFKAIPMIDASTPEWARVMYTEDTNFVKIEALKSEYYKTRDWKKNIHVQNYKHWFKAVNNYVNDDGKVEKPNEVLEYRRYEKIRKSRNTSSQKSVNNSWVNIGPENTVSGGESRPTQANVFCIGVSESNPNVVYAGMETGGIFKTTDKGLSWFPSSWDYAMGSPNEIKVDPLDEDIVYVVDGTLLYKTIDGGNTWSLHYTASSIIEQLYIHTTNTSILYGATQSGVIKSTDSGSTWSTLYTGYVYDIEARPGSNDTLYISVKNDVTVRPEIMISYDAGDNWTLKDNGYYSPSVIGDATVYGCKIGVTPADPDRIYAGIIANGKSGDNGWIGVYYSEDGGESWQNDSGVDGASIDNGDGTWSYPSGSDMNTNWYVAGYSSGYHQGWYNFDLDVSSTDPDKIWIGTIWVCESGNKGANIEYIRGTRSLSMHADVQDIEVVGDDVWWASDGGLNYSNDECQTMETRMLGMSASDFWGFGQGWNEDVWVGGRYHNGNAAFHENYGAGNTLFLGGAESGTGYVNQLQNKKTYFSDIGDKEITTDINGSPRDIANLGLYPTESYFHFSYSEVEWHPYKANTVYVGKNNQLYRSEDGGATFNAIHTFAADIRRFEISRDNPNYIYAIIYHSHWDWRVERSTDGGLTFSELATPNYTSGSWRNLSFTLNPFDKDEIWLASNSSDNGNKIFSSIDGGMTWINRYQSVIANQSVKDLIYHASIDGDKVYMMSNDDFFEYDVDGDSWSTYNTGLPLQHKGFMILPFYRDGKIRMASAKGIWETTFSGESKVQAIPMVSRDSVLCPRDTIQLESYSIANQSDAAWLWTIAPSPAYISDATSRNPKIVLGAEGNYDITLMVNAAGQEDSRTIMNAVHVSNECEVDTIAGNSLKTIANGQSVVIRDANLTNVTHFTVTGWWKPIGAQQAYSSLVSSGDWCAHCDYTEGLVYDYHSTKLWYKWPGNADNWGSNSGITIPQDEWSYVALVITPDGATMYLNDEKYTHVKSLQPGNITDLYVAYGHYSKSFKGEIDEVTIWNTALTEDEVKRLRHITKEDEIESNPNLIAYYQFNEIINGSNIMDKAGSYHGVISDGATLANSAIPVGSGTSAIVDLEDNIYTYDIPAAGTKLYLSDCEAPDGEIVVTKLNVRPDTTANSNLNPEGYWIINHYSEGESFGVIDSIEIDVDDAAFLSSLSNASDAHIHIRPENNTGSTWQTTAKATKIDGNTLTYDRVSHIRADHQISITNGSLELYEDDPGKPCEVDTIPGRTLVLAGDSGDYASIPALNLNSNTITMSAWIKPDGSQNDWSGIIFNRSGSTIAGLSVRSTDELRYHWNGGEYNWESGLFITPDEWNHVALVIEPTQVTIYLNGIASTRSRTHSIEEFDGITRIGSDASSGSRTFDGQIDEVCVWSRALSQDEIRLSRHLTKDKIMALDTDLIVYLQFNEEEGKAYDKTAIKYNTTLNGNTNRTISSVPVGGGVSDKYTIDNPAIINSITGLDLTFAGTGKYPNGEVVISRLNVQPDTIPSTTPVSMSYWIVNNYGPNKTISSLTDITFNNIGNLTRYSQASDYMISFRNENAIGLNWLDKEIISAMDLTNMSVTKNSTTTLDQLGQLIIDNRGAKGWIGIEDNDWHNFKNWGDQVVPNSEDEVVIPPLTPYQPILDLDATVKSLIIQSDAHIIFRNNSIFNLEGQ